MRESVGRPPHPGKTAQDCLRTAAENSIGEHDCQDPLIEVVNKCLSTEPSDRYNSVEELIEAFDAANRHGL